MINSTAIMRLSKGSRGIFCAIFLLIIYNVKGQESELGLYDEVHTSSVKIPTCCAIDLNQANSSCKDSNSKRKLEEWIFPWQIMAENVSTKFPLKVRKLSCKTGPTMKIHLSMIPTMDGSYKLLKNGYLKVNKEYHPPTEYCINAIDETQMEIMVCPQYCDGSRPCIKKCCSLDKVYSFGADTSIQKGCQVNTGEYLNPVFYDDYSTPSTDNIPETHFIENYPSEFKLSCPRNKTVFYLFPKATEVFNEFKKTTAFNGLIYRVRRDGKIIFKHQKDGKCSVLDIDNFCIDGVINYGRENPNTSYINNEQELVMFQCILETPDTSAKRVFGLLYGGIMLASSIFLLLTIATYIALWERHGSTIHGRTILSHTISLFFMYIFLGLAHIIGVTSAHNSLGSAGCIGIGIITHFFFLATFCWLFLISVDLWLTFRAFTPRSGTRSKGFSRYIKYSIFGWGVPAIIVIVGIILEDKYPEDECHTLLTPAYGKDSCFPQQKALGVYLYYPIAVMIFLNVIFYLMTTFKLYLYRESTKMATKDDKQTQFYRLFLKLFFIMGVLWVFEVISWLASGNGYHWYWILFDMLNVLRALAVFIIFVCKRDIIFSLEEKYPCLKPVLLPFAWLFKTKHGGDPGHRDSSMTRTSTLRQTLSTDGKPESIGLIVNTHQFKGSN